MGEEDDQQARLVEQRTFLLCICFLRNQIQKMLLAITLYYFQLPLHHTLPAKNITRNDIPKPLPPFSLAYLPLSSHTGAPQQLFQRSHPPLTQFLNPQPFFMVVLSLTEAASAWNLLHANPIEHNLPAHNIAPSDSAASTGPVLIFTAAADPDALAAVRTLTALLKADLVRYEVHPVPGYRQLREKFDVLVRGASHVDPRAVLCVNCGAPVDLDHILSLSAPSSSATDVPDVRIFVMDSHRPYHLKNINSSRIFLFNDTDDFNRADLPIDVDMADEWGNLLDQQSSDEDELVSDDDKYSDLSDALENSDGSDEDREVPAPNSSSNPQLPSSSPSESLDAPQNVPGRKRERHEASSPRDHIDDDRESYLDDLEEDDVQFDQDADSEDDAPNIQRSNRRTAMKRRREQRKRRRKLERRRRRLDDPETEERARLRLYYSNAQIATSSACVSHLVASVMRRSNIDTLWMAIIGATSQYVSSCISSYDYEKAVAYYRSQIADQNPAVDNEDPDTSRVQNVGYVPSCTGSATHRIAENVELRLDLLRHWSLHDSLLFSSYTATRMASWRQTGKRRLLELLATVGIPLKESQQRWCYMKQKNKIALETHLHRAISRFDLGDAIQYDSFVRTMPGHRGDISAADFVHAISALLEFDDPSQRDRHGNVVRSDQDRFWRAYDAMDSKRAGLLETGLEMAISAQRLTADIGGDVIERRKFVPSGPFRYVFLRDQQHKDFLTHPLLLRRLALFLNTALLRQGGKDKPFIILAPDTARSVWIAVAATTTNQRNDFGHRFMMASEKNGSKVTYDGFDSSVCEIEDGQEIEFVRFLHSVMR